MGFLLLLCLIPGSWHVSLWPLANKIKVGIRRTCTRSSALSRLSPPFDVIVRNVVIIPQPGRRDTVKKKTWYNFCDENFWCQLILGAIVACSNQLFFFYLGWEAYFFILHIKATVSDVQDIVKYLPVMPGRQSFLIPLRSGPSSACFDLSVFLSSSISLHMPSALFCRKGYFIMSS